MDPREYEALFRTEGSHWWFVGLRREIARALEEPGRRPEASWLDAGCGTGGTLARLAAPLALRGFGLDTSPLALRLASRRGLTRLARGDAGRLPFAAAAFDAATSIDVLCHRDVDPAAALAELHRCLRPGGRLVLQVPAFRILRGPHDDAVWTSRRFRRGEVRRLLESAGFEVDRLRYRNSLLFPAAALWRIARRVVPGRASAVSDVRPVPAAWNRPLAALLRFEDRLAAAGVSLPAGLSVFAVARRAGSAAARG
jgi:SAM-dependent methyltransferase